ncbi:YheC/YheD family protein [Cohnella sp. GCM10027633]|uniref:YheC/YheD family protein n=1 Tax=unclassified Cohnella TaxID=2636738 RepID=UPI003627A1AF
MSGRASKHIVSKWLKTIAIRKDAKVRSLVPDTRKLSIGTLRAMLARYGMVYVKPSSGTFGIGVMRVERTASGYAYQTGMKKRSFHSVDSLYRSISRHKRKRNYLVQKGIHLLKYRGRRFDIRVMVQRDSRRRWETTGIIGRVAYPGKVVTNYHSGGKPTDVRVLLAPLSSEGRRARIVARLSRVGYDAAAALARAYPRIDMVGADIGLDASFRPWIIELNTRPDPYLFRHLKDKRTHYKVLRYARALGRVPRARKRR